MTQPRKSIAELLRERMAAKAEANPSEPLAPIVEPEPTPEPAQPIKITIVAAQMPDPTARRNHDEFSQALNTRHSLDAAERRNAAARAHAEIPPNEFCGARTRAGTPCKSRALYRSGRCKNHGGLSTGPKTPEGKARVAMNGSAPKKAKSMAG